MNFNFTPETLSAVAGVVLSLCLSYIPGLRTYYGAFSEDQKKVVMLGLLALVTIAIVALSCTQTLVLIPCSQENLGQVVLRAIMVFVSALIGNQSVFLITPKASDVKAVKEAKG